MLVFFKNKVAVFQPATLLQKRLRHKSFPVNFVKLLRTAFLVDQILVNTSENTS